jgi:hypothetical protein
MARPFRGQETSRIKNYIEIESKTATLASSWITSNCLDQLTRDSIEWHSQVAARIGFIDML